MGGDLNQKLGSCKKVLYGEKGIACCSMSNLIVIVYNNSLNCTIE